MMNDDDVRAVLDFWFGAPGSPEHGRPRECWFRKDDAFDRAITARFGALIDAALAAPLAPAQPLREPLPTLAEIVVLDQFTRNAFRGTPKAFAGDARALARARALVAAGLDRGLSAVQRQFVYLPYEHAEDRAVQDESVLLFTALAAEHAEQGDLPDWAERHRVIVARFGRFPHRNRVLGRVSSVDEIEFLKQPGSGF